jgi:hypothetical protein
VYFAKDDYFYFHEALVKMVEFARNNSELTFVTPYDNSDFYDRSQGLEGPLIRPVGDHRWRSAPGSCLTFLAKRDTLIAIRDTL